MALRVGINGFGRIGRQCFRDAFDWPEFDFVHINETGMNVEGCAHLLEFDSVQGHWRRDIAAEDGHMRINGTQISVSCHTSPEEIPWQDYGVDLVIESSGRFCDLESLAGHFAGSAGKVIVAAPVEGVPNIVMGINDGQYDLAAHDIISAASCTTNCIAPVISALHKAFGIRHGMITTIHDATNTQVIADKAHKDLRRARSALTSLIPTTTGSARAIGRILPDLEGKLDGIAVRVPVLNSSLADLVLEVGRETTTAEVNAALRQAAEGPLAGIMRFEHRPLVSADFAGERHSAIIDAGSTMVTDGSQIKVLAWYDGEAGYSARLMELAAKLARLQRAAA